VSVNKHRSRVKVLEFSSAPRSEGPSAALQKVSRDADPKIIYLILNEVESGHGAIAAGDSAQLIEREEIDCFRDSGPFCS